MSISLLSQLTIGQVTNSNQILVGAGGESSNDTIQRVSSLGQLTGGESSNDDTQRSAGFWFTTSSGSIPLEFVVMPDPIVVQKSGERQVGVRLSGVPGDTIKLRAFFSVESDPDLDVSSGEMLDFTPQTWNQDQFITIRDRDINEAGDGTGVLVIEKTDGPNDIPTLSVNVRINQLAQVETEPQIIAEELPVLIDLDDLVTNPDSDPLVYEITSEPEHGSLNTDSLPQVLYTPDSGYIGPDSFNFKVSEDLGNDEFIETPEAMLDIDIRHLITFTRPAEDEEPINPDQRFLFTWDIPDNASELNFKFDLYLWPLPELKLEEITSAEKMNGTTPLGSGEFDQKTGFRPTIDMPIEVGETETTWYTFVLIRDDPDTLYKGRFFRSDHTLTVSSKRDSDVEIRIPEEDAEIKFGQAISVEARITSDGQPINDDEIEFRFRPPGSADDPIIESAFPKSDGIVSVVFTPNKVGNWQVQVAQPNSDSFNASEDSLNFTVKESESSVQLFNLGATHLESQPLDVSGRVQLLISDQAEDVDLSGITVEITVTAPSDQTTTITPSTDVNGEFTASLSGSIFAEEGDYLIMAQAMSNGNMEESSLFEDTIPVRGKRGYAILVQGSVDNEEGVGEHGNTLEYVKTVLLADGQGLLEDDINFIRADESSPEEELKEAIETWALDKMLDSPASLYVILVNHGNPDQFHMHPDILTPDELNGMVGRLETSIKESNELNAELASKENIILVFGYCFSGSFIEPLSEPGRILISASAPNERSIRGPGEVDSRHGEYFVYLLFRELSNGSSLLDSFVSSRNFIRQVSERYQLATNSPDVLFPGEFGQHPLLDDNGDEIGSFNVAAAVGDGQLADDIFLVSANNSVGTLEIKRTNPTRFLDRNDAPPSGITRLWAEVDEAPEKVANIFIDIKKPTNLQIQTSADSMQAGLVLFRQGNLVIDNDRTTTNRVRYQWSLEAGEANPDELFADPGLHQVFFYAVPNDANGSSTPSEPASSFVYRGSGGSSPTAFNLISPFDDPTTEDINEAVVDYSTDREDSDNALGVFTWNTSTSPVGGIQYIFRLWNDELREADGDETDVDLVLESPPLIANHFLVLPDQKLSGTLWWDVVAIDGEGNHQISNEIRKVEFVATNPSLPGFIFGRLLDDEVGDLIPGGEVTLQGVNKLEVDEGFYVAVVTSGTYTVQAFADDYNESQLNQISVNSGAAIEHDFRLQPTQASGTHTLTINSIFNNDIVGNPQGAGEYNDEEKAEWEVMNPWQLANTDNKGRLLATSPDKGEVIMTGDRTVEVIWKKQVFLEIISERGSPTGGGWHDVGSTIDWSAGQPEVEIVNEKRYNPTPPNGTVEIEDDVPNPVQIEWKLQWYLDLDQVGGGQLDTASDWHEDGDMVTITASPDADNFFKFDHWEGDFDGDNTTESLTVPMNQARRVTAVFKFDDDMTPPDSRMLEFKPGWNLVALTSYPVKPDVDCIFDSEVPAEDCVIDNDVAKLIGNIWVWDRGSYKVVEQLTTKTGYWMYHAGDDNEVPTPVEVKGVTDANVMKALGQGWQLVGAVSDGELPNTDAVNTTIWTWDGEKFVIAEELEEGKAYWIFLEETEMVPLGE